MNHPRGMQSSHLGCRKPAARAALIEAMLEGWQRLPTTWRLTGSLIGDGAWMSADSRPARGAGGHPWGGRVCGIGFPGG